MARSYNTVIPEWENAGAEPPADLKKGGFVAGYKPPAPFFNWLFHGLCSSVKENRESIKELDGELVPISAKEIDAATK